MFTAEQFRAKAAESAESLKHTDVPSEIREFQRSKARQLGRRERREHRTKSGQVGLERLPGDCITPRSKSQHCRADSDGCSI